MLSMQPFGRKSGRKSGREQHTGTSKGLGGIVQRDGGEEGGRGGGDLKKKAQRFQGGKKSMKRTQRRSPCSHLSGMMPVVDINAQLLQALHVGLRLSVARQGLVAAPLCRLQRDRQLEAAEIDKILRAAVSPPPTQSMHRSSCQHSTAHTARGFAALNAGAVSC